MALLLIIVRLFALMEAAKRYEEKVVQKAIIPQRGFLLPDNGRFRTYVKPIKARQWQTFCNPLEATILPLVREFFSNSLDRTNNKINVRGTWVTFSKHDINDYYMVYPPWGIMRIFCDFSVR